MTTRVERVVSGGQTGADRAALDAAVRLGLDYGGWCPLGGLAEDHRRPPGVLAAYPQLRETPERDPAVRTRWNVRDSDATLVLSLVGASGSPGTRLTLDAAEELGRPYAALPADDPDAVGRWLGGLERGGLVLNVAGPREGEDPGLYEAALATLLQVLRRSSR